MMPWTHPLTIQSSLQAKIRHEANVHHIHHWAISALLMVFRLQQDLILAMNIFYGIGSDN